MDTLNLQLFAILNYACKLKLAQLNTRTIFICKNGPHNI